MMQWPRRLIDWLSRTGIAKLLLVILLLSYVTFVFSHPDRLPGLLDMLIR